MNYGQKMMIKLRVLVEDNLKKMGILKNDES